MSTRDPHMFPSVSKIIRLLPLTEGQSLKRIRRLLYPVLQVEVDVMERYADDFSDLEQAIERLIYHGITEQADLLDLLGLNDRILSKFLRLLEGIGHVTTDNVGHVWLTRLGTDSVRDNRKYQRFQSRQIVLCDGMTGKPLPRSYYSLKMMPSSEVDTYYSEIMMPTDTLDTEVLERIRKSPRDYYYNLVDEIEDFGEIHTVSLAFIPVLAWCAESRTGDQRIGIAASDGRRTQHLDLELMGEFRNQLFPELPEPDLGEIADVLYNTVCLDEERTEFVRDNPRIFASDLEVNQEGNIIWHVSARSLPVERSLYMALSASEWDTEPQGYLVRRKNEGRLVYCCSSDQELLREAYFRQAIHKLNRLGQLSPNEVTPLIQSIAEKLNVSSDLDQLIEYAKEHDYEILAQKLEALPGAGRMSRAI